MSIQPIENRLILKPSDSVMRGSIFIPQSMKGMATSCLVMAKGPDVSRFIKVGETVLCEVGFGDRDNNTIEGGMFWCRDTNVYAVFRKTGNNNIIFPIGRKILIKRDVEETHVGSILIPENRRIQSLEGTIIRKGLHTGEFYIKDINPGDKIRLVQWEPHMTEVTLEDGSYGLIVMESDILYKHENNNR